VSGRKGRWFLLREGEAPAEPVFPPVGGSAGGFALPLCGSGSIRKADRLAAVAGGEGGENVGGAIT
jgi:hypothetical protein